MDIAQLLVASLFFLLISLPLGYLSFANGRNRIRAYLRKRNYELVDISWKAHLMSRHGWFIVTYLTPQNELWKANCSIGGNSHFFWTEPELLKEVTPAQRERLIRRKQNSDEPVFHEEKLEKEKLIDGLTSGYKYERIWTAKHIREHEDVDEQVLQILKGLSVDDPEPEVRQAALETVRYLV